MSDSPRPTDRPDLHTADDTLLSGYPGTALLVRSDGAVLATNAKGVALEVLIRERPVPELMSLIRESVENSKISAKTITIEGRQGELLLEVTAVPQVALDRLVLLINDHTMDRNLRAALTNSRQRYKDLVEMSSDFFWEVDADQVFSFVPAKGALGYSAAELVGRSPKEVLWNPSTGDEVPFLSSVAVHDVPIALRDANGVQLLGQISSHPIFGEEGRDYKGSRGICTKLRGV